MKQQHNMAAIYCRLSRDDGGDAESNSIQTQRMMLKKHAKENGFDYTEYIDDGWSGTTFERPSFKKMIDDIEEGKISAVLCKDLSRLGRNNAMVAYYTEIFFIDRDIRFIAVNDNIDTAVGDNEIMGFKSIINEFYARDISKKVKSAKRARAQNGEFSGYMAPIGYRKSPDDKHKLLIEETGAEIVRYIFKLAVGGLGTTQIARRLNEEGFVTPREHFNGQSGDYYQNSKPMYPAVWLAATVRYILRNRAYLGSVVNGRSTTKSFKNQKRVNISPEQHIVIPDMHPALVSQEDFDLAQKIIKVKQRSNNKKWDNIFVGLLKCADCGTNLSFSHAEQVSFGGYFMCNRYRYRISYPEEKACTMHYAPMNKLTEVILNSIRRQAQMAKAHENDLCAYAEQLAGAQSDTVIRQIKADLTRLNKRNEELETIVRKLFEQNALGIISDERFVSMSASYDEEQKTLKEKISMFQSQINTQKNQTNNIEKLLKMVQRYIDIEELDRGILNELIDHIDVFEGEGKAPTRKQKLVIHYRFVGAIQDSSS